jgi:hypothetical protein
LSTTRSADLSRRSAPLDVLNASCLAHLGKGR